MLSKAILALLATSVLAIPQPSPHGNLAPRVVGEPINGGFFGEKDGIGAAIQAAPVYMFTKDRSDPRKDKESDPCYPEGAGNKKGDGPNLGTSHISGKNCRSPTKGKGEGNFIKGEAFPVYFSVVWCGVQWKITYSVYYAQDVSHANDWEDVTITFSEWPKGSNTWYRDSVYASQHSKREEKKYWDIQTVNMRGNDIDVRPTDGKNKLHPKVYVGYWSHGQYFAKNKGDPNRMAALTDPEREQRGDDYWYMPVESDLIRSSTLDKYKGKYGSASSDPATVRGQICTFKNLFS